jgi:hypothetical protein
MNDCFQRLRVHKGINMINAKVLDENSIIDLDDSVIETDFEFKYNESTNDYDVRVPIDKTDNSITYLYFKSYTFPDKSFVDWANDTIKYRYGK